ncbi:MAG TPA: LON peptidase substrate-binding domain-containing protein [Pyrinomonadaceae bacterium]|jgi:Lon protease-like protein|nr:LON peptidase substrate-binding domain-containing protein [Pyrinomonadaceae bacterium]
MTESFERVRGVSELPLFPLPLVLFPGVPLPLHIFEERYRQMLADVRVGNNLFGLSYFDINTATNTRPPIGHVGCAAEVVEAQLLPDGRSNILTVGLVRYRLVEYVEAGEPYLVGRVEFFEDEPEDEALLLERARRVAELFMRIARAVRNLNDDRAGLPELPDAEPERLSFLVAAAMELDAEAKQGLLEMRSGAERLERISNLLSQVVGNYEERARKYKLARGNGHGGQHPNLDE